MIKWVALGSSLLGPTVMHILMSWVAYEFTVSRAQTALCGSQSDGVAFCIDPGCSQSKKTRKAMLLPTQAIMFIIPFRHKIHANAANRTVYWCVWVVMACLSNIPRLAVIFMPRLSPPKEYLNPRKELSQNTFP